MSGKSSAGSAVVIMGKKSLESTKGKKKINENIFRKH